MLTTTCSLGVAPSASRGARLSSRRGAFASREAASLARTRQSREVVRAPGVARAMADDDESLLRKLNPFKAIKKQQEKAAIEKRREEANKVISDDVRKQLFGDGLMGKMAAGLINNAAGALKEQFNAAAEASEVTYDAAVRAVRNDTRVRRALGNDVQATPPMSQMSNSSSVNGVTVQTSTIGFVLQDARTGKQAQAQAKGTTGADGALRVDVAVTVMGTGESFLLEDVTNGADVEEFWEAGANPTEGSKAWGGSAGATIDIDADDVIDVDVDK